MIADQTPKIAKREQWSELAGPTLTPKKRLDIILSGNPFPRSKLDLST